MSEQSGPCHHVWSPPQPTWIWIQPDETRDLDAIVEDPRFAIIFCLDCEESQTVEKTKDTGGC